MEKNKLGINNIFVYMKIQKMIKNWKKRCKKSRHRVNILKQWESTQQTYIKDLHLIVNQIQTPLKQAQIITNDEDRILFPNLNSMIKLSEEMLADIQSFLKDWHPRNTLIGQKLINFHKYFIIYREYCNNFYKGQAILKNVKNQQKYKEMQSGLMMDAQSYIIKPVQRPPKYQLLLREYLKALPKDHADVDFLQTAIEKYHDVNEQNNQSMDLQIRQEKMIEFDVKYGGIISASRVFLTEEICKCIDFKIKLLIFNDLIIVLKVINEEHQEGFKKIFLDGQSYIEAPMDGKYFINKLFICGNRQNVHLNFLKVNDRNRIFQIIKNLISELYRKQYSRTSLKKKINSKMTVEALNNLQISGRPMLKFLVMGVQKRPVFTTFETYYILKIQASHPNNQFQYSYLRWEQLLALQKQIKSKNKMMVLPTLDEHPESMSFYDIKKNKTKIIEYREIFIERFINYIFRAEQFEHCLVDFGKRIKINQKFWAFLNYYEPCSCDICLANDSSFMIEELEEHKSQVYERLTWQKKQKEEKFVEECLFNSFIEPSKIINSPQETLMNLRRRLTWLDSFMGRIDFSLLPRTLPSNLPKVKIIINILSLKEQEGISIYVDETTTVQQIMEEISGNYRIQTMRDFGLFLEYEQVPRLIDRDEILLEVLTQAQYEIQDKKSEEQSSFWSKISKLKKWSQEILSIKKSRLYLRKYLFVEEDLEINACYQNPARYPLLVEEIFYRFKKEILILNINDMKRLCALYYILSSMDKLAHLCQTNFRTEKLKVLMPENKWHLLNDSMIFGKDVYMHIEEYSQLMERTPSRSNTQTIFSKVEVIYDCVLHLVYKSLGWNTLLFEVKNYDPPSLPGNIQDLLLGINRKNLIIIRHKQLTPLLQISLSKLQYKVTAFSIFIDTPERIVRFDGKMMYDIKKIIEMYRNLANKFDQSRNK